MKILKDSTYQILLSQKAITIAESQRWMDKAIEMEARKDGFKAENVRLGELISLRDQEIFELKKKVQIRDQHGHSAKKPKSAEPIKKGEK